MTSQLRDVPQQEAGERDAAELDPGTPPERTKTRLLELLKRHGPQTAQDLAGRLQITSPAARRHLTDLQAQGLVQAQVEKPGGRGRPQHVFGLTEHAEERTFPRTYASLCLDVLESVSDLYGRDAVDEVLQARSDRLETLLRELLPPEMPLAEKLRHLTGVLTELGFAPHLEREGEHWVLVQGNCPNLQVARHFKVMCGAELAMYAKLLGVPVTREEHLACGQPSCRYRLAEEAAPMLKPGEVRPENAPPTSHSTACEASCSEAT
ncbi:helix-turn-helix transcriptional regulator [Deinococcus wulumuqiensis]|uniref:helix-turn-helix transcriptional regulator n=1 Tax=Deinococcus wulumuqiensis TaxID=980427 RepID=UPI00243056DE|nr:metalloregulator ArsR/SmtB family transcription factor [Deinococcus wulumuqiensis]